MRLPFPVFILLLSACASGGVRPTAAPEEPEWTVIASFTTQYRAHEADRSHNIATAAGALDGAVIEPGGAFSFNARVGKRSLESGYRNAPTLTLEGKEPALGGGVCQVSSTVFNALLLADLTVAEHHPHSRAVSYLPMGRDAAVAWPGKDLEMLNPHPFPVRLAARAEQGRLVVQVRAPARFDHEVRVEVGDIERASPRREFQVLERPDELAVDGFWVKLYRKRVRDGSVYEVERIGDAAFYPFARPETAP